MEESGEGREEIAPRGNDWEVVSLTASAYAAAPGPKPVGEIVGDKESMDEEDKVETSQAMFMSGHFLYPAKQSEDVSDGPELGNSPEQEEQNVEELASLQTSDEIAGSVDKDEALKGLTITEDNPEAHVSETKEITTRNEGSEVHKSIVQPAANIVELEQSIYQSAKGTVADSDVETMVSEMAGPSIEGTADEPADITSSKSVKDEKKARSGVPCAPWWKRQAASLYDHVKEANPLWSIVIAAAVMGLAVLGHRWQQRKSHVTPLNLQFSAKEEKPGKMLGPITRLKEAFMNGSHGSASTRSHISSEI